MNISKKLSQKIVKNLKNIIHQDLNFMNNDGYIIASTDPDRINKFHQAAKYCTLENKTIIINYDGEYSGAKKGINIPVELNNEVVGVIGISGDIKEVKKYGEIIKKMTEILLKEDWIKENKILEMENRRNLIENLISNNIDSYVYIPKDLENSNKVFAYSKISKNLDAINRIELLKYIETCLLNVNCYATIIQNELIIIFINYSSDSIKKLTNHLIDFIDEKYSYHLQLGISNDFSNLHNLKKFYLQSKKAFEWINHTIDKRTLFYKDLGIGYLATSINKSELKEFSDKILLNLDNSQLEFYKKLLNLYGLHNGSIKKISEDLFMHKNSVQYRINKLKSLTGYDIRNIDDYMILWFAFLCI